MLSTGRVVACDPLVFPATAAFSRAVTPGEYPVEVSLARAVNGDERIAAARVVFREGVPARWELALLDGQRLEELEGDDRFGYGVDAGMGCFMDERARELLLNAMSALPEEQNYYDDVLEAEMKPVYKHTRDWTSHLPAAAQRDNVVAFSSGLGDGVYPSWWGLDADGQPMALVTDFGILEPECEPFRDSGAGDPGHRRS